MTGSRHLRASAACAMVFLLTAARPAPAQDVEVFFQPGVTSNHFTGELGRYSSGSLGLAATQGIQIGAFAGYLSLGTDFYLTNQPPPPYTRGLRTFTIATGLRLVFPFDPVTPIIGIEYANLGVVSNALNRFTGSGLAFDAVGAHGAVRWRFLGPIYAELQLGARLYVDMLQPTASIGGVVSVGISGQIR